jgi:endonuclease/exonuclease/phosphatase family metal-dependent hydrolase
VRALVCAAVAVTLISVAGAQQVAQIPEAEPGRRPRLPAVPSDVLTHSALVPCTSGMASPREAPRRLRIATWNIKAARSAPLDDIAAEISAIRPDVVALQEVDMNVRRTGYVDQPTVLAQTLGYQYAFAASIKWDDGDYGLAVLSRWPLSEVTRHTLDDIESREPRIILETTICAAGRPLRLFNHHADVRAESREAGLADLRQIIAPRIGSGILVLGDFNEEPTATGVRSLIEAGLIDLGAGEGAKTIGGARVDYLMADSPLATQMIDAHVWPTAKSDHNAVVVDLDW